MDLNRLLTATRQSLDSRSAFQPTVGISRWSVSFLAFALSSGCLSNEAQESSPDPEPYVEPEPIAKNVEVEPAPDPHPPLRAAKEQVRGGVVPDGAELIRESSNTTVFSLRMTQVQALDFMVKHYPDHTVEQKKTGAVVALPPTDRPELPFVRASRRGEKYIISVLLPKEEFDATPDEQLRSPDSGGQIPKSPGPATPASPAPTTP